MRFSMPRGQRLGRLIAIASTNYSWDQSPKPAKTAVVLAAIVLTLAGCGGQPRLAVPDTPTPAASQTATGTTLFPATPINRDPEIGDVVWTTALSPGVNTPVEPVTTFAADATSIIASLPVRNLPRDAAIELLARYLKVDPDTAFIANDWWFEELRSEPAFQRLVGRHFTAATKR